MISKAVIIKCRDGRVIDRKVISGEQISIIRGGLNNDETS